MTPVWTTVAKVIAFIAGTLVAVAYLAAMPYCPLAWSPLLTFCTSSSFAVGLVPTLFPESLEWLENAIAQLSKKLH